jgi:hypothetical protein
MSKKRKKRRRTPKPLQPATTAVTSDDEVDDVEEVEETDGSKPARAPGPAPSPFPSLGISLARGASAVGAHPVTLAAAFLSLLATWGAFVGVGAVVGPRLLGVMMSVSPSHLFSDVPVALDAGGTSAVGLAAVVGIVILRALTYGLLLVLILQALRGGRPEFGAALRRLPQVIPRLVGLYVFETAAVVFAQQLIAAFLPQFGILVLAAGIYFLVFAPVVLVAEEVPIQEALRRGLRAARLPGTRHLMLVMAYFLVLVYTAAVAPLGLIAPATPSVVVWAFALLATFVHVAVLAAFAYRWLEVRDEVAEGPAPRRRP